MISKKFNEGNNNLIEEIKKTINDGKEQIIDSFVQLVKATNDGNKQRL